MNIYEQQAQIARARADAVSASRARHEAITESAEGKRTPTMARHFAFMTEIEPAAARAAMAVLPAENANVRASEAAKAGWAKAAAKQNAGRSMA